MHSLENGAGAGDGGGVGTSITEAISSRPAKPFGLLDGVVIVNSSSVSRPGAKKAGATVRRAHRSFSGYIDRSHPSQVGVLDSTPTWSRFVRPDVPKATRCGVLNGYLPSIFPARLEVVLRFRWRSVFAVARVISIGGNEAKRFPLSPHHGNHRFA